MGKQVEVLDDVIFYNIEKAIKAYRQYAQAQIKKKGLDITIDQWLVLKVLSDNPDIQQKDLATKVFKDNASITRIIELLVKNKYLTRKTNKVDGRRVILQITAEGNKTMDKISEVVLRNREHALKGITKPDIELSAKVLKAIANNCIEE